MKWNFFSNTPNVLSMAFLRASCQAVNWSLKWTQEASYGRTYTINKPIQHVERLTIDLKVEIKGLRLSMSHRM
jgi:hypothetical protein